VLLHAVDVPHVGDVMHPTRARHPLAERVLARIGRGAPEVAETRLAQGPAARAILEAVPAVGADILVVGSRGRGGFAGLTLGSVSSRASRDAPCAVLVVRSTRRGKARKA
jgi:nucleotide-binding universal stress UspA family protein